DSVNFRSTTLTDPAPANYVVTLVNSRSEYIAITSDVTARPSNTTTDAPLTGGNDGAAVVAANLLGSVAPDNTVTGSGLRALDKIVDVNLIAIPGEGAPSTVNAGIAYCKNRALRDCFYIGDMGVVTSVPAARLEGAVPDVSKIADAKSYATTGFGGT